MIMGQLATAIAAIFVKYLKNAGVPLMQALVVRAVGGFTVCWLACKMIGLKSEFGTRKLFPLLIARALMGGVGALTLWLSFDFIPSGDAMALNRLSCVTTVIFAWIVGWESINWIMLLGSITTALGEIVIVHPPFLFGGHYEWTMDRILGISIAIFSTIFMSMSNMTVGKIGTRLNTLTIALWVQMGLMPLPITSLIMAYPDPVLWTPNLNQVGVIAGFAVLAFLQRLYIVRSLQLCNATLGNTLATSSVVFSYILGYFMLDEDVTILAVVGTMMIFFGVWVVAVGKGRKSASSANTEEESA